MAWKRGEECTQLTKQFSTQKTYRKCCYLELINISHIFSYSATKSFLFILKKHMTVFIVTENEDSDPSEDSSKSKSSQEEKNSQGQRRRGM